MPIKIEYGWKLPRPAHRPRTFAPQEEIALKRRHVFGGETASALAKETGFTVEGMKKLLKRTILPTMDLCQKGAPAQAAAE